MGAIQQYLAMGGYGAFVWPAFGVTALVMIGLWWDSVRTLRRNERALAAVQDASRRRRREDAGEA